MKPQTPRKIRLALLRVAKHGICTCHLLRKDTTGFGGPRFKALGIRVRSRVGLGFRVWGLGVQWVLVFVLYLQVVRRNDLKGLYRASQGFRKDCLLIWLTLRCSVHPTPIILQNHMLKVVPYMCSENDRFWCTKVALMALGSWSFECRDEDLNLVFGPKGFGST